MKQRYTFKTAKTGTTMCDEQLFKLTVIDNSPAIPAHLKDLDLEDLTISEVYRYKEHFEALN